MRLGFGITALSCVVTLSLPATAQRRHATPTPPPPAQPAPSAEETQALQLFEQSVVEYRAGNFQRAADLLRRAYELHAEPTLLYNLARALEGLGDQQGALDNYARYLEGAPNAADRGAIEQRITTLRREIAERDSLARAARQAEDARPPPPPPRPAPAPRSGRGPFPWIVSGLGVAGLGAGVAFGLLAVSKNGDADDARAQTAVWSGYEGARDFATVANVCFIAGGVVLAGGVLWVLLSGGGGPDVDEADEADEGDEADLALTVTPRGLALRF